MTSGEYRTAAGRMEEIGRQITAVNRQYALGALERLLEVLSGAAAGFPADRLAQCSRELAAAARLLEEGAAAAERIARALEAAEALAAAPPPPQPTFGGEPVADGWMKEADDSDGVFTDDGDFPEMDLLARIRAVSP